MRYKANIFRKFEVILYGQEKKLVGLVKLQLEAGKATPAPPVGTALGPKGINIMDFCKRFNAATQGQKAI